MESVVPFTTAPMLSPSIVASPETGKVSVPFVPSGVVAFNENVAFPSAHEAPNQPKGVVNPPSAAGKPER